MVYSLSCCQQICTLSWLCFTHSLWWGYTGILCPVILLLQHLHVSNFVRLTWIQFDLVSLQNNIQHSLTAWSVSYKSCIMCMLKWATWAGVLLYVHCLLTHSVGTVLSVIYWSTQQLKPHIFLYVISEDHTIHVTSDMHCLSYKGARVV